MKRPGIHLVALGSSKVMVSTFLASWEGPLKTV